MKLMVQGDEEHQTKAETIEALCIGLMEQNALLAVLRHLQSFQFQVGPLFLTCTTIGTSRTLLGYSNLSELQPA